MRSSYDRALESSFTSAWVASQTSAMALMNEILVARKALAAGLDQFGGGEVGDHDRDVAERGVHLPQDGLGPGGGDAEDDPVGVEGVVDGEALAEELGVPGELGAVAGQVPQPRAASRWAVPTGTVDLPTTRQSLVMYGPSDSTTASR